MYNFRRRNMSKKIRVKPSRAQAKFSVVIGFIFVLIGIFVAIPNAGLFGIFWTGIAIFITYSNYRDGFTDRPLSHYEIDIEDSNSTENRLKKLDSLYNQGLISREEYDEKRKDILNDL